MNGVSETKPSSLKSRHDATVGALFLRDSSFDEESPAFKQGTRAPTFYFTWWESELLRRKLTIAFKVPCRERIKVSLKGARFGRRVICS